MKFGEAIRHLREHHPMTLRELAERIGVKHPYLYLIEKGKKPPFSADKLGLLYDALQLDDEQRHELNVKRIKDLGQLDISGLTEDEVHMLYTLRNRFRRGERYL